MGKRGPRPEPKRLLQLKGSWRGNLNPNEPDPERDRPACPKWLTRDAKRMWWKLVPRLEACGLLTYIDGNVLARYCQLWSRWKKAEEFLDKFGSTYPLKTSDGKVRCFMTFPDVHIASSLAAQLTRLEQELGLTPSARSRIDLRPMPSAAERARMGETRAFFAAGGVDRPRATPAKNAE